jgi:hypothetical protein
LGVACFLTVVTTQRLARRETVALSSAATERRDAGARW